MLSVNVQVAVKNILFLKEKLDLVEGRNGKKKTNKVIKNRYGKENASIGRR